MAFSACLDYPFLTFTEGIRYRNTWVSNPSPSGFAPATGVLPTTEAICAAVAVGVGIAVVPALATARCSHQELRTVDLTNAWAHRVAVVSPR